MLRDMRTRFGRTRLGYVWAVIEPILHLVTLGSVFAWLNHSPPLLGNNLYLYYVTGLIPFLMFSHVSLNMIPALTSNGAVLQLSIVKQTDVIMAKAILGLGTEIFVGILVFSGFALLGFQSFPADPLTCMAAVFVLWLFALGMGLINLVVAEHFHTWEAVYTAAVQLMYFASGIYYAPIMMPVWIRDILIWNPVLQGIEWFRSGFFQNYSPHWLDQRYLVICAAAALLIGFALERALRSRLVVYA
jgi:capsular polysaccharide transport system permease protein